MEPRIDPDDPLRSAPEFTRGETGFTLIELMVVVAILSLLTLTATLSINRPRTPQSQDWARFERIHDRLREQAVMGQEVLGLRVTPEGYRRLRRGGTGWLDEGPDATWAQAVRVEQPFGTNTVVIFLPSGESTPVRLAFAAGDGAAGLETRCESDGWEPVTCALP